MMNGMPYQQPYGQPMWPMGPGPSLPPGGMMGNDNLTERVNNLENQVNRMERQLRRVENRLNRIESTMVMPLNSQDTGYGNNNSKYMM